MGKYIKKSKGTGEVAVMEVSAQGGCLGVKTRARTLALQRDAASSLQKAASYLQLRSRRLEKPPFLSSSARPAEQAKPLASDHAKRATHLQERRSPPVCVKETDGLTSAVNSARSGSVTVSLSCSSVRPSGDEAGDATGPGASAEKPVSESETAVEASFGENILEGDGRESCRSVRETTPCSLMRNSENLEAPGSTTRPTNPSETNRRTRSETHRSIPTADEMEEFFAAAERQQLRSFSENSSPSPIMKEMRLPPYNYDPVKDLPLPGRYEWIRLTP